MSLRPFDACAAEDLARFLEGEALRLDRTGSLLARARGRLRDRQVLAPGESVLRRAVGSDRQAARTTMAARMTGIADHFHWNAQITCVFFGGRDALHAAYRPVGGELESTKNRVVIARKQAFSHSS